MAFHPKRQILSPEKRGSRSPEEFRAAAEAVAKLSEKQPARRITVKLSDKRLSLRLADELAAKNSKKTKVKKKPAS